MIPVKISVFLIIFIWNAFITADDFSSQFKIAHNIIGEKDPLIKQIPSLLATTTNSPHLLFDEEELPEDLTFTLCDLASDDTEPEKNNALYFLKTKSLVELNSPLFYLTASGTLHCSLTIKGYTLRTINEEDFSTFKKFRSDPTIMMFMNGGAQDEASSKMRFDILLNRVKNNNPMAWLAVVENKSTQVIGFAALGLPSTKEPGVGELVVFFEPNSQAQGLGSAMLHECLTTFAPEVRRLGCEGIIEFQCFLGEPLQKIYAAVHAENTLALKILNKSKMRQITEGNKPITMIEEKEQAQKNNAYLEKKCFEYILP